MSNIVSSHSTNVLLNMHHIHRKGKALFQSTSPSPLAYLKEHLTRVASSRERFVDVSFSIDFSSVEVALIKQCEYLERVTTLSKQARMVKALKEVQVYYTINDVRIIVTHVIYSRTWKKEIWIGWQVP